MCEHQSLALCSVRYLVSKGLFRCDEDTARVWSSREHSEDGKLGTDGLPTAGRSTHKHIIISVVESIEHWERENMHRIQDTVYSPSSLIRHSRVNYNTK